MDTVRQAKQLKAKRRILVVDDNLDHVRSLTLLFGSMGHQVEYAINATVAVDIARRFRPDVILLDLLLPDGHGSEVCMELRTYPELRDTRIFGISASSRMIDLQLALDGGCNDVLRKPVSPVTFERLIAGGMSRRKLREFMSDQGNKAAEQD